MLKEQLKRKLVVRISESQFDQIKQHILAYDVSMSQVVRDSIRNKFNNIYKDDIKQRKFKF